MDTCYRLYSQKYTYFTKTLAQRKLISKTEKIIKKIRQECFEFLGKLSSNKFESNGLKSVSVQRQFKK